MKGAVLVFCLLLGTIAAEDNSTEWMLFPDGDGNPHIISLLQSNSLASVGVAKVAPVVNSDVIFQLYRRSSPSTYSVLVPYDDNSFSGFDASLPTRLYIHGWMSSSSSGQEVKNAYLSVDDYNVIVVDWSELAKDLYSFAKDSVKDVGAAVATLLDYLVTYKGAKLSTVHVTGHSLGAHVAGVAGSLVSGTLSKITGLDPAAPLYGNENLADRLDKGDASFVEVIHTCGGLLGWSDPLGHVDFFPNDGTLIQPGCGLDLAGACSHSRSHEYFGESITTSVGFYAYQCSSYNDYEDGNCYSNSIALMGEYTSRSASGRYYLDTTKSSPFARGL